MSTRLTPRARARERLLEQKRRQTRRRLLLGVAAGVITALAVAGVVVYLVLKPDRPGPSVTVVLVDRTPSVKGDTETWASQIATIGGSVLGRREWLLVGGFIGPTRTVVWLPRIEGDRLPPVTGGDVAFRGYARRYADRLAPFWTTRLSPQSKPEGTNWLGALRSASRVKWVKDVWLFSDLVQQADGVDLTEGLSDRQLSAAVDEWAPRLSGLAGHVVHVVGSGDGVHRTPAADLGEKLMTQLADAAGFQEDFESFADGG